MEVPEWLPDWRYLDDYPNPQKMTYQHWAWEFLRRNSRYQQMYAEYCRFVADMGLSVHDLTLKNFWSGADGSYEDWQEEQYFLDDISHQIRSFLGDIVERYQVKVSSSIYWDGKNIPCPSFHAKDGQTFSVSKIQSESLMLDPGFVHKDLPPSFYFINTDLLSENPEMWEESLLYISNHMEQFNEVTPNVYVSPDSEKLTCWIDLSGNINDQINRIKQLAEEQQKFLIKQDIVSPPSRKRIENYTPYLRTFDASSLGLKPREIAPIIHPEIKNEYPDRHAEKRIENYLKRAENLVETGYFELAKM